MKTLEQIDAKIAELQAERERIVNGGFVQGEQIYHLLGCGFIYDCIWYSGSIDSGLVKRGRIARTREELEAKDRREVIETQMLKYADWDNPQPVYLEIMDGKRIDADYGSKYDNVKRGNIPMSWDSAKRCMEDILFDDLKFYLTWGRG